jgi:hypothetical protein
MARTIVLGEDDLRSFIRIDEHCSVQAENRDSVPVHLQGIFTQTCIKLFIGQK